MVRDISKQQKRYVINMRRKILRFFTAITSGILLSISFVLLKQSSSGYRTYVRDDTVVKHTILEHANPKYIIFVCVTLANLHTLLKHPFSSYCEIRQYLHHKFIIFKSTYKNVSV